MKELPYLHSPDKSIVREPRENVMHLWHNHLEQVHVRRVEDAVAERYEHGLEMLINQSINR